MKQKTQDSVFYTQKRFNSKIKKTLGFRYAGGQ